MFLSFYALGSTKSTHLSLIEYLVTFLTHTFIEVIDCYWDVLKKIKLVEYCGEVDFT